MVKLLIGAAAAAIVALSPANAGNVQPNHGKMDKVQTRADVQGHVATLFSKLDSNRDGFVSEAEVESMQAKRADLKQARIASRAEHFDPAKVFARLDSNKDGKLTKAEVEAVRAAHRAAKSGDRGSDNHGADRFFARVDSNRDGFVTLAELQAAPKPAIGKAAMDRHGAGKGHMLAMADLNHDGKVSLAEAQQAALARFDRADANKDGKVTPEERKAAWQKMRAQHKG